MLGAAEEKDAAGSTHTAAAAGASTCAAAEASLQRIQEGDSVADSTPAADSTFTGSFTVTGFENRPDRSASNDHAPGGESFHGFTEVEFVATQGELGALPTQPYVKVDDML